MASHNTTSVLQLLVFLVIFKLHENKKNSLFTTLVEHRNQVQ